METQGLKRTKAALQEDAASDALEAVAVVAPLHGMAKHALGMVIGWREALDAARTAKDLGKAQAMAKDIAALKATSLASAQSALRTDDVTAASVALGRVRYYARFLEEVEAFEEELLS